LFVADGPLEDAQEERKSSKLKSRPLFLTL